MDGDQKAVTTIVLALVLGIVAALGFASKGCADGEVTVRTCIGAGHTPESCAKLGDHSR